MTVEKFPASVLQLKPRWVRFSGDLAHRLWRGQSLEMSAPESLVVPSRIPWDAVKGHALEECIFWLLEALGAKQLDWRVGGIGQGTADGGRDLECIFNVPEPSGEVLVQKWWVESKGRSSTVSPSDIKQCVHTVSGRADVDVHLIVTNQRLSNPTKDWIAEWKRSHRRPDIRVWERQDLERLVSRNPIVAIRIFPKALTAQGKCEVMTTRFWDYIFYTDAPTLAQLWKVRGEIEWNCRSMFAALVSECAIGDLAERPWGSIISFDRLIETYLLALVNSFYLLSRSNAAGVSFDPVVEGLAYLLTHLIARFDPDVVADLTERSFDAFEESKGLPQEVRRIIIDPVVARAFHNASEACLDKCHRVFVVGRDIARLGANKYWDRFRIPPDEEKEKSPAREQFYIESHERPCTAALPLTKENTCPMLRLDMEKPLRATFEMVRQVIINRSGLRPAGESVHE